MVKTIFTDRDGVLLREPLFDPSIGSASEVINSWKKFEILPDVVKALTKLKNKDYQLFIITNQDGIEDGSLSLVLYEEMNKKLLEFIRKNNRELIVRIYTCMHSINGSCNCRKPKRGLIDKILNNYPDIDLSKSWFIGDRATDIKLGKVIGSKTVFLKANHTLPNNVVPDMIVKNFEKAVDYILKNQQ